MRVGPYSSYTTTHSPEPSFAAESVFPSPEEAFPANTSAKLLPGRRSFSFPEPSRFPFHTPPEFRPQFGHIHQAWGKSRTGCTSSCTPRPPGVMSGPGNQQGDLHRTVIHIEGEGAVPLAPDSVVPHIHAVVRRENHDGILPHAQLLQPVENPPDIGVHGGDCRVVAAKQGFSHLSRSIGPLSI